MKEKIVVLDVETTGLDFRRDEIIEFAALLFEGGLIRKSLHFLVCPEGKVPHRILNLTGINEEELAKAKTLGEYKEEILDLLQDAILVGHNLSFDINMLEHGLRVQFSNQLWDTLDIARIFFPSLKYYRLGSIAEKLQLVMPEKLHRAHYDAQLTWQVLEACWKKGLEYDLSFFNQVNKFLGNWPAKSFFMSLQREVLRCFPQRPIRTDLGLAAGTNLLFKEPSTNYKVPPAAEWVKKFFAAGGILAQTLPGYECREGQVLMAGAMAEALFHSEHVAVEAGTGTGKSLAYLLPALWWAKISGKKVLVATHTIPLQEQLQEKDLPLLAKALPFPFQSMVLKGKGNYFCLRNWLSYGNLAEDSSVEEITALLIISAWLRETRSGDLQELPQIPGLARTWSKLSAENCIPLRCPQAGSCFLLRAKQRAEEADLLIVNHSLLFADIKAGFNVLPEYSYAIIDEAHHLYQSALEHLGTELSLEKIIRLLARINQPAGPSLLGSLKAHSPYYESVTGGTWESIVKQLEEIPALQNEILEQAKALFALLEGIAGEQLTKRLVMAHRAEAWWSALEVQVENLTGRLSALAAALQALIARLQQAELDELEGFARELSDIAKELDSLLTALPGYLVLDHPGSVIWLEKMPNLVWKLANVDVSAILQEKFFNRLAMVGLTSATLSIAGSFEHFLDELGLPQTIRTLQVNSPFDYENQMRFYVVKGLFNPLGQESMQAGEVAEFIAEAGKCFNGRTLVLFTSHRFLQATYYPLRERLENYNLEILGQGIDGSRTAILTEFKRNPQSVLLGANSFWEGVDIIGETLSCVILVKLPFSPPNRPLVEARTEFLAAQGRDPFRELFLPEAIIRFKQGFGRLIRSQDDKGTVIVLDSRIAEKSYGRLFLASLPVRTHIRGDSGQIIRRLEAWANN